uniref:Uncharacterized protein n=1 Tax=Opuntia streptacantha TaxID=393608 RepID=A0A7C9AWD8_OPUST
MYLSFGFEIKGASTSDQGWTSMEAGRERKRRTGVERSPAQIRRRRKRLKEKAGRRWRSCGGRRPEFGAWRILLCCSRESFVPHEGTSGGDRKLPAVLGRRRRGSP